MKTNAKIPEQVSTTILPPEMEESLVLSTKRVQIDLVVLILSWLCLMLQITTALATDSLPLEILPSLVNSTQNSDIVDLASSVLVDGDDVPSDFRIDPVLKGPPLLPVSCLLNSVHVALQLAIGDYEGTFPKAAAFQVESHPQVEIIILPYNGDGATSMPWKYAVWALNASVKWMLKNNKFRSCIILIHVGDRSVGAIQFKKPLAETITSEPIEDLNATKSNIGQTNVERSVVTSNTGRSSNLVISNRNASNGNLTYAITTPNLAVNETTLILSYELVGTEIGFTRICYTALDVLRSISSHDRKDLQLPGSAQIASSNLYVTIFDADPPRTTANPPYMQTEWFMYAMGQIPAYMYGLQSYRQVEVDFIVDRIRVGGLSVMKEKPKIGGEVAVY